MRARDFGGYAALAALLLFAGGVVAQQGGTVKPPEMLAAGGGAAAAPPLPEHPATEDQVREYLALTGIVAASREGVVANLDAMQMTAMPYYPASFWADMKAALLKMDLVAVYAPVLQRYLSEENMAAMLAFYRSPAGKAFLSAQPAIVRDEQAALQAKAAEIGQAAYARHRDEIEAAKKKYDAEHTGAAKPATGAPK